MIRDHHSMQPKQTFEEQSFYGIVSVPRDAHAGHIPAKAEFRVLQTLPQTSILEGGTPAPAVGDVIVDTQKHTVHPVKHQKIPCKSYFYAKCKM